VSHCNTCKTEQWPTHAGECIVCAVGRADIIESSWQDAELRADKNLKRVEELEATLKTLAAQAMYAAGYTKKGDWKNETL
jgi:hypothetical protein